MSTDRVTTNSETVPNCWTELDELFFTLVGDVLSTSFLWGAATLLASYDADTDDRRRDAPRRPRPARACRPRSPPMRAGLPRQRGLDGWTVDPGRQHARRRLQAAFSGPARRGGRVGPHAEPKGGG